MIQGIGAYTFTWVISCLLLFYEYQHVNNIGHNFEEKNCYWSKKKISLIVVVIISAFFSLYNYYVTIASSVTGGDRQNYILNFNGVRATPSIGLGAIMKLVHLIGGNIMVLYCFTTFFCVFITLIAYRESEDATPYAFYLLCLTQYFLATLTALKQCYASAFAVLFFVLMIEKNTKKSRIISGICVIMACLFHSTGFILIPLFFLLNSKRQEKVIVLYFLMLLIIALFFKPIMIMAGTILSPVIPSLGAKISEYFIVSNDTTEGIAVSFLKGMPYYFITFLGSIERNKLVGKIKNYDKYLLVCLTGAFLYLVSLYSAWFNRFIYFFNFAFCIFFGKIIEGLCLRENKMVYNFVLQSCLIFITYRFLYLIYSLYGGF